MLSRKPDCRICSDVAHLDLPRTESLLAYGTVVGRVIFFFFSNCSGKKWRSNGIFNVCRRTKNTAKNR